MTWNREEISPVTVLPQEWVFSVSSSTETLTSPCLWQSEGLGVFLYWGQANVEFSVSIQIQRFWNCTCIAAEITCLFLKGSACSQPLIIGEKRQRRVSLCRETPILRTPRPVAICQGAGKSLCWSAVKPGIPDLFERWHWSSQPLKDLKAGLWVLPGFQFPVRRWGRLLGLRVRKESGSKLISLWTNSFQWNISVRAISQWKNVVLEHCLASSGSCFIQGLSTLVLILQFLKFHPGVYTCQMWV